MLQITPKKFKSIKNKVIPSPIRPKFRNKAESNIYFLSQRKVKSEKKASRIKTTRVIILISLIGIGGYFLSN